MKSLASRWFFLGGVWEAPTSEGAQLVGYVPHKLCVPRWSKDFMTLLREVVQVVKVTFSLKENPHPSDFITEVVLKAFRLALIVGSQAAFATSPSTTIPPLAGEVTSKTVSDPAGCLSAIKSSIAVFCVLFFSC